MTRRSGPANRTQLLLARRRLERVHKGRNLLRRKREALAAELFRLARPAVDARTLIEQRAANAWPQLARALAAHGVSPLRASAWPLPDPAVSMTTRTLWGITVAEILDAPAIRRSLDSRATTPASNGPAATRTADAFEALAELLIDAAPREMLLRRLGAVLARTTRQVRALEQRLEPDLEARIARLRRTLEERQREDHARLRHILRSRPQRI